jgi:hypothetical protein
MATAGNGIDILARLAKLPFELLVSSMETMAAAARRAQQLYNAGVDAAAAGLDRVAVPGGGRGSPQAGTVPEPDAAADLVRDTFNGLVAFVVPGPDGYSVAQGVTTADPGGIAADITNVLIQSFNSLLPSPPQGPLPATTVAGLLNQIARQIDPAAGESPAGSPFARLSFAQKGAVFAVLQNDPSMAQFSALAGLLLIAPAALTYSEYGVFDFRTRSLTGWPVGWSISSYSGVADGRDELKGYFQNRQEPLPSAYPGAAHIRGAGRDA